MLFGHMTNLKKAAAVYDTPITDCGHGDMRYPNSYPPYLDINYYYATMEDRILQQLICSARYPANCEQKINKVQTVTISNEVLLTKVDLYKPYGWPHIYNSEALL